MREAGGLPQNWMHCSGLYPSFSRFCGTGWWGRGGGGGGSGKGEPHS